MAIIKCKMCGGDLNITEGMSVVECEYCGSRQTIPTVDDEKKLVLFERAERLRRSCEFDKAAGVYESIVADFRTEAEAYWGLVLCKYGIEYVDDPATGKKVPTCHRSSFDSVMDDPNFELTLENTDAVARRVYREEAKAIEELRKGIIEVSSTEEPYDIFINYKETDENGDRTLDSVIAQDIYDALCDKGYRVFFSRISLEEKLGTEYEPYIFAALNSAKLMLSVGTDYEHFNAVWVKNEWSRFLQLIAKGEKKTLIPCFKNIDAYDMPQEFAKLSAQDMGKVGAMQDLLRGVEKILGGKAEEKKETVVVQQSSGGPNVQALLKRGEMALADGKWDDAKGYYDRVLDMDAECGEAYLGLFLVEQKASSVDAFVAGQLGQLRTCLNRRLTACDQQEERIQKAIQDNVVPSYVYEEKLKAMFVYHRSYQSSLSMREEQLQKKEQFFSENRTLNRAKQYATPELMEKLKKMEDDVLGFLRDAIAKAQAEDEANIARITAKYAAHLEKAEAEAYRLGQEARPKCEADYVAACQAADVAGSILEHRKVAQRFAAIKGYKDSEERLKKENESIKELRVQRRQIAAEEIKRQRTMAEEWQRSKEEWQRSKAEERKKQSVLKRMFTKEKEEVYQAYQPDLAGSAAVWGKTGNWHVLATGERHTIGLKEDGTVVAVGKNEDGQCNVNGWTDIVAVSAGDVHTIGLKADGTVVAAGSNDSGRCDVSGWTGIVAVSAGKGHTVGLRADGTVVAVGWNAHGKCNVNGWTDIVAISAGDYHTVGLKADGTVVAKGWNEYGQCDVSNWIDIVAVSAGGCHTVGLKEDGTVVAIGYNKYGHCNVSRWKDIVAVSAGINHTVGLKADGTVVAVGNNDHGQCNVSDWRDIVAVSAGAQHTVGLKSDGTVVAVGYNSYGQCNVDGWTDIVAVSAGCEHTVGLKADGTAVATKHTGDKKWYYGQCEVSGWTDIKVPEV